jgi:2-phosphosulfolactate phosphatase
LALPFLEFRQMLAQRAPERYAEISERSGSNENFDPEPLGRGKECERRGSRHRDIPRLHDHRRRPGERRFADHRGCTVEEALALRAAESGAVCIGEIRGLAPDAFDYGNSPFEIATLDFSGKTIIQRTSAGTQGIVAANAQADRLYAASLVTAEATVRALLSGSPGEVTIVAMGDNGALRTDEDELTAIHLRNRLEGRPGDTQAVRQVILAGGEVRRFYDPARLGHRPEDVEIALDIDRYDFAIRVDCHDGRPIARIERV